MVRCAWCHDDAGELEAACVACRTLLHADCAALAGACPTLGCGAWPASAAKRSSLRRAAQALVTLPLLAVALAGLYLFWPEPEPDWRDLGRSMGSLGSGEGAGACSPQQPERALREQLRAWVADETSE